ncbi:MAG: helix-turn-helix domain-containing protein [Nitrososphaera sp.]|nr:helix-turn-helix domain-containing protein [Nitrososphaera sp.]MCI0708377.1 helix-turn-helix domain-containing protein [Ignavibacteriota bacterium]
MKSEIYKRIPNLLRKYRRISGFSQREVALLLGYKNGNRISRWESGEGLPSALNIFRLSVAYRVLIDSLFIDHIRAVRQEIHERERKLFPRRRSGIPLSNYS